MIRLDARIFARRNCPLLGSALIVLGAGCAGEVYAGPARVEGPEVVAGPAGYPAGYEDDVVYMQYPPAVDIEAYPSVMYEGINVYYVDGRWYQRGPRGWAYYRREPPELDRQREERSARDRDPRWGNRRGTDQRTQERVVPPAQRSGATEAQAPDHRAAPAPTAQPRRGQAPATIAPKRAPRAKRPTTSAPEPTGAQRR